MSDRRIPSHDQETVNASDRSAEGLLSLRVVLGDRAFSHELPREGEALLGRGLEASVLVDHPSVSRVHARVCVKPGLLTLEDLASANGTRVSGRAVPPNTAVPVQVGDAIELGDAVVVIQHGHVERATRPQKEALRLGQSAGMQEVERLVERIAPGTISVMIVGETGSGKEVVADAIHRRSKRATKPFVRLNCAAVAEQLLESEWFGHERGAFTGALQAKPGLLETADGGTVLLDEVGELPLNLQAKLLRVLEERSVLRVGGVKPRRIDVRFLAATNRDIEAEVARGTFRQDLYFRLNGVTLRLPPLRQRREEIAPLARLFIAEQSDLARGKAPALDPEALAWLDAYPWPGNVRELKNMMERAVLLATTDVITLKELPTRSRRPASDPPPPPTRSLKDAVAEVEKQRVLDALAEAGGNQKRAAELLGVSRGTLLSRLDAFGIPRPRKT
jgi:two-component system, NtrC family, response regulator AtoC